MDTAPLEVPARIPSRIPTRIPTPAMPAAVPATVVMPQGTPFTQIERTAGDGARVVLRGEGLSEARKAAFELAAI